MSAITQSYKIDMTSGAVPLRIKVSQYDAGIRTLTFALFNLGTKLTSAQLSSLTAYVQGTKQDKKGFEYECTADFSAEGCSVTVAITEQMTACAGDVVCELVLVADDDRIGSANFILEVERAALGADTDISETELPDIITAGRQYAAQAEDAAERAEEAAAGVDNYALAGAGMMTEYSAGVIDTNIYLHREPKIGDRLLIMFTQTFTQSTPIKIYKENGGTAYTLNFDLWDSDYVLKGLCLVEVVDFLDNFALRWLHSYSGTEYQAGQYIGISGNYINNIAPQLGDNSEYHEKDSAITDGDLGTYGYYAKYIIINFKARAVPDDTTGKYSLQLSKGATLEDASLVDRDGNDFTAPIKAGAILLCSVDNSNDIVTVLNNDIMANGDIIDGQGNTLSVLAEALTKTASGNPVEITDCAGGKARSLKTTINAIQDLHGLPFPYVGGAYKNKLNYSAESFSVDKNRTETLLGTFTCTESVAITASWYQSVALSDSERNTITVTNQATGTVYYATNFTDKALAQGYHESPIGYNQPDNKIPAGTYNVKMWAQGISDNYTLTQPMIRLSSDTDTTWQPYSNICPISGRDRVAVDDDGANLASKSAVSTNAGGAIATSAGTFYSAVEANKSYILSFNLKEKMSASSLQNRRLSLYLNDSVSLYQWTDTDTIGKQRITITPTASGYLNFWAGADVFSADTEVIDDIYLTDAHSSATIQLGQTVYGADINWDTGAGTVTHVATSITGDNVSTVSDQSATDTEGGKRININIINAKYCGSGTGLSDIISDRLSVISADNIYNNTTPNCIAVNNVGGIVLRYAGAATVEAAKAALNANPVQACYALATPIELTLTPTEVQMLKGYNRVTIESGSIELGYISKIA